MRLAILQADRVDPENQTRFGDYPQMFVDTLGEALGDATFAFYDVQRGAYPERIGDCDGYLITGSRASAYDDEPWIERLGGFVRELHAERAKTVGICFGHQLIAQALGGEVRRAAGWGVGVHAWAPVRREAWMQPVRGEFRLVASHQDQVVRLPPGARLLARSEFCPYAAFALGRHVLAFQGHPEFSREYAEFLMRARREALGDAFDPGIRSLGEATDEDTVAKWIAGFLN